MLFAEVLTKAKGHCCVYCVVHGCNNLFLTYAWQVLESAALREAVAGPPVDLGAMAAASRAGRPQTLATLAAGHPELAPEPPAAEQGSSAGAQSAAEAPSNQESVEGRTGGAEAAAAAPGVPAEELQGEGAAAVMREGSQGGVPDPLDGLLAPLPPPPAPPVRAAHGLSSAWSAASALVCFAQPTRRCFAGCMQCEDLDARCCC